MLFEYSRTFLGVFYLINYIKSRVPIGVRSKRIIAVSPTYQKLLLKDEQCDQWGQRCRHGTLRQYKTNKQTPTRRQAKGWRPTFRLFQRKIGREGFGSSSKLFKKHKVEARRMDRDCDQGSLKIKNE
jgi:hypothetical protein